MSMAANREIVIPAYLQQAGMATVRKIKNSLFPSLSSFRRKPESSGLYNHIPPACCRQGLSGNDNRVRHFGQSGADRHNKFVGIPANARLQQAFTGIHNKPLDSSFRWNDGVVGMTPFVISAYLQQAGMVAARKVKNPLFPPLSSFRRKPESSGLYNHIPA